jgi:hypothetical protein
MYSILFTVVEFHLDMVQDMDQVEVNCSIEVQPRSMIRLLAE